MRIVAAHPGDDALEVEHLVADVPLDREISGWDRARSAARSRGATSSSNAARRPRSPRAKSTLNAFSALVGNGSPIWKRSRRDHALVAQRAEDRVGLDRIVDARPASKRTSAPSRTLKTGVSYAWRGTPVGDAVAASTSMPGSASASRCAHSRPTARAARSPRPAARRPGRRRAPRPARNASSVEPAGRLPTSSSSLVTRPLIPPSPGAYAFPASSTVGAGPPPAPPGCGGCAVPASSL